MGLRTAEQYLSDLKQQKRKIFLNGERITGDWTESPLFKTSINSNKVAFDLAHQESTREVATVESPLINESISRFTHLQQSKDELIQRALLNRECQLRHGSCHAARCGGTHAINGLYATTYDMDQKLGTDYHERLTTFIKKVQKEDLAVTLNSCDWKGDRSKHPAEQPDPDMYLHIVERRSDGIVIKGAKAHQSTPAAADYHFIVPYVPCRKGEEDWAVACVVPADVEGLAHITEWPSCDASRFLSDSDIDIGNFNFGAHAASLMIFDNVFVPYERVFMCGETEFTQEIITLYTKFQRTAGAMCKSTLIELIAGAAATIAEYNGLKWMEMPAMRDKIMDILTMAAQCRGTAIGGCAMAKPHASGLSIADEIIIDSAKLCHVEAISKATTLLIDITGGIIGTLPSAGDLASPETRDYLLKYLKAADGVSVENRMRMIRLCEYLSGSASTVRIASMHTGGSPEVVKYLIRRFGSNIDELKGYAKKLARIEEGSLVR